MRLGRSRGIRRVEILHDFLCLCLCLCVCGRGGGNGYISDRRSQQLN